MDDKQIEEIIERKIDSELKHVSLINLIQSDWKNISGLIKFIFFMSATIGFGMMEVKTFLFHSLKGFMG